MISLFSIQSTFHCFMNDGDFFKLGAVHLLFAVTCLLVAYILSTSIGFLLLLLLVVRSNYNYNYNVFVRCAFILPCSFNMIHFCCFFLSHYVGNISVSLRQ